MFLVIFRDCFIRGLVLVARLWSAGLKRLVLASLSINIFIRQHGKCSGLLKNHCGVSICAAVAGVDGGFGWLRKANANADREAWSNVLLGCKPKV